MKKSFIKTMAIILSVFVITNSIAMISFAFDNTSKSGITQNFIDTHPLQENEFSKNEFSNNITEEMVSERTRYTKTYLMEDGTYCDIVSAVPIHEFVDNNWENINEILDNDLPETLEESYSLLQVQNSSPLTLSVNENIFVDNNETFLINQLDGNARYDNSISNFGLMLPFIRRGNALIKINSINNYLSQNKIVLSANLNMQYSNLTSNMVLKAYEEGDTWDITTNQLSINTTEMRLLDYVNITTNNITNNVSLDITDSYCRWEKGVVENNGIVLNTTSGSQVDFNNICITVQYKKISELDSNFTYHEKNMETAGSIYINDFTNTPTIKMNIVEGDAKNNFDLQLIYNAAVLDQNSSVLPYTKINYDSKIELNGNTLTWIMPNGDIKTFTQPVNAETINDFQTWQENIIAQNLSVLATVNIDQDAIDSEGDNTVYDSITIDYFGYIFEFNEQGFLSKINIGDNAIIIERESCEISRITDETGNTYYFYYADYDNGQRYLHRIVTKSADNILLDERIISLTQENGNNRFVFDFYENTQPSYTFDSSGRIIRVSKDDSNYIDFEYTNIDNSKTLEQYTFFKDGIVETLDIDSKETFQRTFTLNGNKELFQYDRSINLITYRNSDNPYTCATYDENELINTYSFNNIDASNNLINNSSFDEQLIPNDYNSWMIMGATPNTNTIVDPNDSNNKVLEVEGSLTKDNGVMQYIMDSQNYEDILKADQTYVLTCEGVADTAIPTEDRFFGVKLEVYSRNNELIKVITMPFDTCVSNKSQFRMIAFKLEEDALYAVVKLIYSDQDSVAYFDNIGLYEGKAYTKIRVKDELNSNYIYDTNSNENSIIEYMTDGILNLENTYSYYSDGQIKTVTDLFGVTTEYEYVSDPININGENLFKTIERVTDGTETNPTDIYYKELLYNSEKVLKNVSTTIDNIVTGNLVSISNSYEYDDEKISSINHNGITYSFSYLGNKLSEIKMCTNSESGLNEEEFNETQECSLISYGYSGENVNSINYANGWRVSYTYENNHPIKISYYDAQNALKAEYTYTYDDNGTLISTYDSITNLKYELSNNDCFEIYKLNEIAYDLEGDNENDNNTTEPVKIFSKEEIEAGVVNSYYRPIISSVPNDTGIDTTTVTKTTTINNSSGRNKTSEIEINKASSLFDLYSDNEEESGNSQYLKFNYQRESQRDYFQRLVQKDISLTVSDINDNQIAQSNISSSLQYLTENNTTYGLPEYYNYCFSNFIDNVENIGNISIKYNYDKKGNVHYIYFAHNLEDGTMSNYEPVKRYEYDRANQLVMEIDLLSGIYAKYTYDSGMNLTSKIYYTFDSETIDITMNEPINSGVSVSINYEYDNDKLVSINVNEPESSENNAENQNHTGISYNITYDNLGNPLNYFGISLIGESVEADLKWMGKNLVEFETDSNIFKYTYDANGYRLTKEMYEKSSDADPRLILRIVYVWDNGILTGLIFDFGEFSLHTDIIYDQEGVAVGIVTPYGIPYYFIYDNNGNVMGLINLDNEIIASISYDSFGVITSCNIPGNLQDVLVAAVTIGCLPCTYHGCIYDFESGLYFSKGRCYSPVWGRYINPEYPDTVSYNPNNIFSSNFYLHCDNNSISNTDTVSIWSQEYKNAKLFSQDVDILETEMSNDFLSRPFCAIYANEIIRHNGEWTLEKGNSYKGLNVVDIAATLFAKSTGNYAMAAVNKVNASWGDGWIQNNSNSSTIKIYADDPNINKYTAIWYRAEDIRNYAILDGIIITL